MQPEPIRCSESKRVQGTASYLGIMFGKWATPAQARVIAAQYFPVGKAPECAVKMLADKFGTVHFYD